MKVLVCRNLIKREIIIF